MVWLTIHMWGLLTTAYILGMFSWWLLSRKREDEPIYETARIYEVDDREDTIKEDVISQDKFDGTGDKFDESTPQATIRNKIYETPAKSDDLTDLPDLDDTSNAASEYSEKVFESDAPLSEAKTLAPKLYSAPMQGAANDLKRIKGIGPTLERTLNATGIYYFDQIAAWTDEEIAWIDNRIDFPGRVTRERWVSQAIVLAAEENKTEEIIRDIDTLAPTQQPIDKEPEVLEEPKQPIVPDQPVQKSVYKSAQSTSGDSSSHDSGAPESMLDKLMARKNAKS